MPDVLNVHAMIWHAWYSLSRLEELKAKQAEDLSGASLPLLNVSKLNKKAKKRTPEGGRDPAVYHHYCPHPACYESLRLFNSEGILRHM